MKPIIKSLLIITILISAFNGVCANPDLDLVELSRACKKKARNLKETRSFHHREDFVNNSLPYDLGYADQNLKVYI